MRGPGYGVRGKCGEYKQRVQAHPPSAQPRSLDISLPASPTPPPPQPREMPWERGCLGTRLTTAVVNENYFTEWKHFGAILL